MSHKEKVKEQSHSEFDKSGSFQLESHIRDSSHTESHNDKNSSGAFYQEGYQFTVSNGAVTSVAEVGHGMTKAKFIKPYESYSVSGNDVLNTASKGIIQEISRYSDSDADGVYQKIAEAEVLNLTSAMPNAQLQNILVRSDHMEFVFDADRVVAASHVLSNGVVVSQNSDTVGKYAVQNGFVVESVTKGATTQWEVFRDGNNDGIYTEVAHGNGPLVDLIGLASNLATTADSLL